jgi:GxxExxY protein
MKAVSAKNYFFKSINKLIVEVKATEKDSPLYKAQLLTYLRLTGLKLGLLINFGKESVKEGISRVVNGLGF